MKKLLLTALIFLSCGLAFAQRGHEHERFSEDDIMTRTLEDMTSSYNITAEIVPESLLVRGKAEIRYRNLSGDTLHEIYLDLGYNTYAPGGEPDLTSLSVDTLLAGQLRALNHGYCRIDTLLYNVAPLLEKPRMADSSLMKITLPTPIAPDGEGFFIVAFETRLDSGGIPVDFSKHVLTVDTWYPAVAVYLDGHWLKERDATSGKRSRNFGVYRVGLRIDSAYSIIGSGHLLNEREFYGFLPRLTGDSVYVDILDQQVELVPGQIYKPLFEKGYKTYYWRTRGVRNFPIVIGKGFLIDRTETEGTLISVAYPPDKNELWQGKVVRLARDIISVMTPRLGIYPFRELTIVTGSDKSEIGSPDNFIVIPENLTDTLQLVVRLACDIIISWLPQIADNRDSGRFNLPLAAFLTLDILHYTNGVKGYSIYEKYVNSVLKSVVNKNRYDYYRYAFIYRPADLQMLRVCIGKTAFVDLLKDYLKNSRYRFVLENNFTHLLGIADSSRCGWFVDSNTKYPRNIDYQLEKTAFHRNPDGGTVTGEIVRTGDVALPVEIGIILSRSDTLYEKVGVKEFRGDKYSFSIEINKRPLAVILDPRYLVPDINRDNNYFFFRYTRFRTGVPKNIYPPFRLLLD